MTRESEEALLRAHGWQTGETGILVRKLHRDPLREYWSERAAVLARLTRK